MTPQFPVIELFDRLAIAQIKFQRTGANAEELQFYTEQARLWNHHLVEDLFQKLLSIHQQIWELEKELKSGVEQDLPLEEIGRRAIAIRDWNNQRVSVKNLMAQRLGDSIVEIKHDHLSESPR